MSAPIPVFSDRPKAVSTPKLRALVKFPGNVQGGAGIEVTKAHGTWTIELDYNDFAKLSAPPTGANNYVLNYDALTQSYALVPTGAISTANVVDVRNFGAACDTVQIEATVAAHISIASDLITLTAPGASFTVADVGKTIIVPTAGPSGTGLQAFIASVITDTKIILSRPAAASIDSTTLLLTYGTDDTASIQAAVNSFTRRGVNINLSGKMLITAPIIINQSADTRPNTTQGSAINLRGGGSGSTYIIHSGCFSGPAIEFIGNELPFPSLSITSQQTWQGFTVASAVAGATGTAGISIAVMAFSKFFDIMIYGLEVGISATDLLSSSFYGCNIYNTKQGITAAFSAMSRPNAISFHGCEFGSCSDYGIGFTGSTAITIVGGAFQGCGNHTSGLGSIYLANPNVEGGVALSCYGAYFEANSGLADIVLSKSSADQSLMILDGCDFHRSSADHCIAVVQGTGAGRVDLVCRSSFRHFPPYVLPGLPAIVFISDAGCEYSVDTSGSFFQDHRYSWSETTLTPHAMVKFVGATGSVINSTGVIGVTQNSTGSYTIHLRNAMRSTNPILATSMTDVGEVVDFGSTASFVSVRTLSTAGAVFNPTSVSVVIYDGAA